jgi:hypothetical protein
LFSKTLSLELIFFFNLVTGAKVTGKSFVKVKRDHKWRHTVRNKIVAALVGTSVPPPNLPNFASFELS